MGSSVYANPRPLVVTYLRTQQHEGTPKKKLPESVQVTVRTDIGNSAQKDLLLLKEHDVIRELLELLWTCARMSAKDRSKQRKSYPDFEP